MKEPWAVGEKRKGFLAWWFKKRYICRCDKANLMEKLMNKEGNNKTWERKMHIGWVYAGLGEAGEVYDTNRFGRRSGLGAGRGLKEGETRASVRAEEKAAGIRTGGGEPPVKTDSEDLKMVKRARSLVVCVEETRNDYSDEVIRELKQIRAAAARMIAEYEERQRKKRQKGNKE